MDRFQQAKEIASGAANLARLKMFLGDSDIEEIHKKRMAVCAACTEYSKSYNMCKVCGCLLAIKTRSMESSCTLGHWKAAKKL